MPQKNSLPMEIPKKRVAWIDVSRVLAALLIMYVHLSSPLLKTTGIHLFYNGRVPFFLVLAGYFLARNITWNKAVDRALWLFIPYMIWNVLYLFLLSLPAGSSFQLADLAGIRDVFLPGMDLFSFGSESPDVPPIGPSWFLRDIIILTLLTPLLARIKILLPPALLLFFSFCNMAPDPLVTLSVGSCAFYLLGVVLSSRRIDDIHLVLNKKFGVVFEVRNSMNTNPGTIVQEETPSMEAVVIRGISIDRNQARVTITGIPDQIGYTAQILGALAEAEINLDMILANTAHDGYVRQSFTMPSNELGRAQAALKPVMAALGSTVKVETEAGLAKLSLVGIGMRSHSGVGATAFKALADANIKTGMISTSEIKIAVMVDESDIEEAARVVHRAFNLGV